MSSLRLLAVAVIGIALAITLGMWLGSLSHTVARQAAYGTTETEGSLTYY